MKYFKRHWNELRGDKYDSWGSSWWFFEANSEGVVFRQVEQYDNGQINRYDKQHLEDEYGGLSLVFLDLDEVAKYEIAREEFGSVWNKATNF